MFDFGFIGQGQSATLGTYAKIRTNAFVDVKIARVEPKPLKVTLHQSFAVEQGEQFVIIEVTMPANAAPGEVRGFVELETNHPGAKKIRIPVLARVIDLQAGMTK